MLIRNVIQRQSCRQISHYIAMSNPWHKTTERRPAESIFNSSEFSYFHNTSMYNIEDRSKMEEKKKWGPISNGNNDDDRPCLCKPENNKFPRWT